MSAGIFMADFLIKIFVEVLVHPVLAIFPVSLHIVTLI